MIVRYVRPLTENQRHTLAEIMKHDAIPRARVRAHGILLSAQGMRIKEIEKSLPSVSVHWKPYKNRKTREKLICIILMNQDLLWIPIFHMPGKNLEPS